MAKTKNPTSRRFVWIGIILLLSLAVWLFVRSSKAGDKSQYIVAPIQKGDLNVAVTATGTLNPVLNVQVGSQISGIIQKLNADFNSPVKEGEVIAQIEPGTYQATVAVAEGDLANAKAALELATVNANRTRQLLKSNTAAPSEMDAATASLHQAEAQIKIKQGSLDRARIDLARCTIYAPIDGIVISRSVDVGQTVAASLSAPVLFTIANDLTKMQIDANVAEADVGTIEIGQNVNFSVDAFPSRIFHGEVTQVRNAPLTVQNVVTYDAVISVNNSELKLKPGMTANVSISVASRSNVLKISNSALRVRIEETSAPSAQATPKQRTGSRSAGSRRTAGKHSKQAVYVLPAGTEKPQRKEVEVGLTDGTATEIISGLTEGDPVVTLVIPPKNSAAANAPQTNPFAGEGRRGR